MKIVKPLIVHFCPVSCYCLPLRSKSIFVSIAVRLQRLLSASSFLCSIYEWCSTESLGKVGSYGIIGPASGGGGGDVDDDGRCMGRNSQMYSILFFLFQTVRFYLLVVKSLIDYCC
jgi:hypothetical protein